MPIHHRLAGDLLARIEATIDRWLQDGVIDIDGQRTGGLLELDLPDASKIVVNTQPPLHEVWLATRGGGYHFRHVDGQLARHARWRRILRAAVGGGQCAGRAAPEFLGEARVPQFREQIEDAFALLLGRWRGSLLVHAQAGDTRTVGVLLEGPSRHRH